MSKNITLIIFLGFLTISLILLILIHGLKAEILVSDEMSLFISETALYLTGLGTLFFGWKLIDHKLPSKKRNDEH